MAENKVILEFVGDVSGLKPAIDTLSQLGNLSQEQVDAFKKANEQFKQANKSASDTEKSVSKLSNSFKQVSASVVGKGFTEISKQASLASLDLSKMNKRLEELALTVGKEDAEFKELAKTIGLYKARLVDAERAVNMYAKSTDALSTALGELEDRLYDLALAGQQDTQEFKDLTAEVVRMKTAIKDVDSQVDRLVERQNAFTTFSQNVQLVTSGFMAVQGAAALAGGENEELQKTLVRLNAVMAISQALEQARGVLLEQQRTRTGLYAAATKIYTFVTSGATLATRAFNAALAATGIGIAIIAVYELAKAFDVFGGSTEKATKEIDDNTEALKKNAEERKMFGRAALSADEIIKRIQSGNAKTTVATVELQDAISKLQGEINSFTTDKVVKETEQFNAIIEESAKATDEESKAFAQVFESRKRNTKDAVADALKEQEQKKITLSLLQKELDTRTKVTEQTKRQTQEIIKGLGLLTGNESEKALNELSTKIANAIVGAVKKAKPDFAGQLGDLISNKVEVPPLAVDVEIQNRIELERFLKEQLPQFVQNTFNDIFAIAANNRNAQFEEEQRQLDERRERELSNKNLTESQKAAIEKKFRQQQDAIRVRQFNAEKQASIAQATINGALAITKILASLPGGPLNPATVAAIALSTISTAAQIAVISSQKAPRFAKGGFIGGKPHSQGGTIIEAEKDEFVVRKSVARQNKSFLEAFNNGVPIAKALERSSFMPSIKDNDMIVLENKANIDYSKLGRAVAREMSKLPQSELEVNYRGLFQSINSQQSLIEWQKRKYN